MTYALAALATFLGLAALCGAWVEAAEADAQRADLGREAYARIARDSRLDVEADAAVRSLLDELHLSVQTDA